MSVHWGASGEGGRQRAAGDPGSVSETAPRGKFRISEPGPGASDLPPGPVGGARRGAAQPAAGTGPARPGANPLSTLGSVRAGWPGTDQPASRAASTGGGANPHLGGGVCEGTGGGNMAP